MDATALLREFCDAVEHHDGKRFAGLFCEDGVYHDVFYGEFAGRAKIAEMINDWFFKSATDMRWDMHDPVSDGKILYARYTFSYKSLLPEAGGGRVMFEGVAIMRLRDGRIADYRGRQYRHRLRRHEFRPGAHRQNSAAPGRRAQGPP